MLDHVRAQIIAHGVSVPDRRIEQALHALGSVLADGFGHLPAILALDPPQEAGQVAAHPRPHLDAPKAMRDALLQAFPGGWPVGQDRLFPGVGIPLPCICVPPLRDHTLSLLQG